MMDPDFYAILGVAADADAEQIKAAFRQLARALHPDAATAHATGRESSPERLTQVVTAWRILHDPAKRAAYDRTRAQATPDTAAWPSPGAHEHTNSGSEHGQAPLIAGPTVIHTRTPPSTGPHIRVGPTIRLHD
ncbi:DnaJ-class molecular chaperone [Catenulispora sp. GAS73]|uniref:J domain-containing protein n=1 Tax=Catenulispora sp. GAS73 TaxID=3156269 RepID=UPI0035182687